MACHQLTADLAETLSRADRVLFIDAAEGAARAGYHVERVAPAELAPAGFTHHVTPAALLTLAQTLYDRAPEASALIVDGVAFGYGEELSPEVEKLVPELGDFIADWAAGSPPP